MSISKTNLPIQCSLKFIHSHLLVVSSWEIQGQLIDHRKGASLKIADLIQAEAIQDLGLKLTTSQISRFQCAAGCFLVGINGAKTWKVE